jgi:hypothetical protein
MVSVTEKEVLLFFFIRVHRVHRTVVTAAMASLRAGTKAHPTSTPSSVSVDSFFFFITFKPRVE